MFYCLATTHQEERIELERGNQPATDDTHPYLSSIATSDIGEQIEGNSGYEGRLCQWLSL